MIFVIEDKNGAKLVVEKESDNHRQDLYTIKMACDDEKRRNGGICLINLAVSLERNGFKKHAAMGVYI